MGREAASARAAPMRYEVFGGQAMNAQGWVLIAIALGVVGVVACGDSGETTAGVGGGTTTSTSTSVTTASEIGGSGGAGSSGGAGGVGAAVGGGGGSACPEVEPGVGTFCEVPPDVPCIYGDTQCVCHLGGWECFDCPTEKPTVGAACSPQNDNCLYGDSQCFCAAEEWVCGTCPGVPPTPNATCEPRGLECYWSTSTGKCFCGKTPSDDLIWMCT